MLTLMPFLNRETVFVQVLMNHLQEEVVHSNDVQKLSSVHPLSLMSVLKKEGPWKQIQASPIHCQRRNLSRRKLSACSLVWRLNMKKEGVFGMVGSRRKVTQRRRCWFSNQQLRSDLMMRIALEVQGTSTSSLFVS